MKAIFYYVLKEVTERMPNLKPLNKVAVCIEVYDSSLNKLVIEKNIGTYDKDEIDSEETKEKIKSRYLRIAPLKGIELKDDIPIFLIDEIDDAEEKLKLMSKITKENYQNKVICRMKKDFE